jgi:hypothetical protein
MPLFLIMKRRLPASQRLRARQPRPYRITPEHLKTPPRGAYGLSSGIPDGGTSVRGTAGGG